MLSCSFHARSRDPRRNPGAYADVNVFDLDALTVRLPEYVHDFPVGAGPYVQRADGYRATVVNGSLFVDTGEPTGAHAGHTLRRDAGVPAGAAANIAAILGRYAPCWVGRTN